MIETLLGAGIGGLLRLAPEVLRLLDRKNERKHEALMQDKATEVERIRGANRMEELTIQGNMEYGNKSLDALMESVKGQAQLVGNVLIDGINQLMRPAITAIFLALWAANKIATGFVYTAEDRAILAGIINFWFLNRVLTHKPL